MQDIKIEKTKTIAILDNDVMSLPLIKKFVLHSCPDFSIRWTTTDGYNAIDKCINIETRPSLLIVDMSLNNISGLRVCKIIREYTDEIDLLAMTSFPLSEYSAQASQSGCQGIIEKRQIPVDIKNAITEIQTYKVYNNPYTTTSFENSKSSHNRLKKYIKHSNILSPREVEIINLCIDGYNLLEISKQLNISDATVRTHISHIKKKLGANNLSQAVITWYKLLNKIE